MDDAVEDWFGVDVVVFSQFDHEVESAEFGVIVVGGVGIFDGIAEGLEGVVLVYAFDGGGDGLGHVGEEGVIGGIDFLIADCLAPGVVNAGFGAVVGEGEKEFLVFDEVGEDFGFVFGKGVGAAVEFGGGVGLSGGGEIEVEIAVEIDAVSWREGVVVVVVVGVFAPVGVDGGGDGVAIDVDDGDEPNFCIVDIL